MTDFHRANRRKARRLQLAAVDSHLGDVIGAPLAPMRPVYLQRAEARCFVQRFTHRALAIVAAIAVTALLAAHLWSMFVYFPHSPFMVD